MSPKGYGPPSPRLACLRMVDSTADVYTRRPFLPLQHTVSLHLPCRETCVRACARARSPRPRRSPPASLPKQKIKRPLQTLCVRVPSPCNGELRQRPIKGAADARGGRISMHESRRAACDVIAVAVKVRAPPGLRQISKLARGRGT